MEITRYIQDTDSPFSLTIKLVELQHSTALNPHKLTNEYTFPVFLYYRTLPYLQSQKNIWKETLLSKLSNFNVWLLMVLNTGEVNINPCEPCHNSLEQNFSLNIAKANLLRILTGFITRSKHWQNCYPIYPVFNAK